MRKDIKGELETSPHTSSLGQILEDTNVTNMVSRLMELSLKLRAYLEDATTLYKVVEARKVEVNATTSLQ